MRWWERGGEEENRADYFLSLAGARRFSGRTDGKEGTKFEVELFFFPSWKKVQDARGVGIVVTENKDFTSEFRGEVSLSRSHFEAA